MLTINDNNADMYNHSSLEDTEKYHGGQCLGIAFDGTDMR